MRRRLAASIAVLVTVFAGQVSAVSAQAATGTIRGKVSLPSGEPVFPPGRVEVFFPSGILLTEGHVFAGSGDYEVTGLPAGEYKLNFQVGKVSQWAHQKLTFADAELFTVTEDGVTVVDETMFRPGAIQIAPTDSVTGQPIDTVCASLDFQIPVCGGTNGVLELSNVSSGDHSLELTPSDGLHARKRLDDIHVDLGATTRVDTVLTPTAAITATVVNRQTNEAVSGVCVLALVRHFGAVNQERCTDSDPSGQVLVGELPDGNYRLLAIPDTDGLGAQWVGADGGTGDEREANVVRARAGRLSTVNPIRLDPAGTIAGVITEAQTGNPVRVGDVCPTPLPGLRLAPCADGSGNYELPGLGPYRWPVLYPASFLAPYAWEWSGKASDRYAATPIQVIAGQTVVHDVRMRPAARLTGRVLNPDGTVFTGASQVQVILSA